jgi:hypothetical protein
MQKDKRMTKKFVTFATIAVLSVALCFTASASDISGVPPPLGDTTIAVKAETVCEGYAVSDSDYNYRWINADDGDSDAQQIRTAGQIRYQEEVDAIYGTTHQVKAFDANTGNGPNLDADNNITFVADPGGGRLVSNEKVGLQVVNTGVDDPPGTPSEGDLSSLCPWKRDPGQVDAVPASNEAAAMESDMNVSIVQANTAATVSATGSERNVSYDIVAAGPQETGGYGAGTINAGMEVEVQKTTNAARPTSASQVEYQEYQDSLTSSGMWIFSKQMDYISDPN